MEGASRGAVVGYSSNIEAFPFYRCRFVVKTGTANTEADAKAAKGVAGDSVEASAVKDGEKEVLEIFGKASLPPLTAAEQKASKKGVTYTVVTGFESEKFLRTGKASGTYDAILGMIRLEQKEGEPPAPFHGKVWCPLFTWYGDRGVHGPDRMLAKSTKYTPTFLGERASGGHQLVGIRFNGQKYQDGSAHESESWFDSERGYLPVEYRTRSIDTDPFRYGVITEVKEFRPGRFFPMRRVEYTEDKKAPGKWRYEEVTVLELNVETRPAAKDLSVIIPGGTQVLSYGRGYFNLKQDERLSPDDLDELFDKLDKSVDNPQMDTAIEHTADRPHWWVWAAAGSGATLILLGTYLWWRKRRVARRASP